MIGIAETPRFSVFNDVEGGISGSDVALLKDVSKHARISGARYADSNHGNEPVTADKTQSHKFKEAARAHESDEDEARWEERLRKVKEAVKPE